VDPSARTGGSTGITPLRLAVQNGNVNSIRLPQEYGADIEAMDGGENRDQEL
jgi:hypothetical protein